MPAFLDSLTIPVPEGKPRFRGYSHQIAAVVALLATLALVVHVSGSSPRKAVAALVFGLSLTLLLGTSAVYHRINWKPGPRAILRRMDHAAIFVLVAGGYTPLFLLVPSTLLPGESAPPLGGYGPLVAIWVVGVLGMLKSISWPGAPRWLTAALYVGMGWMAAVPAYARTQVIGPHAFWLVAIAGLIYSLGALVYAVKKPNPLPGRFGYHEVFHLLVIVASTVLFVHVLEVLATAP